MPEVWAAVRRWVASVGPDLWPVLVAVAVVVGTLSLAITPVGKDIDLTSAALHGSTLRDVRPSRTGEVNPTLAAAVDASLARRGIAVQTNNLPLFLRDVTPALKAKQARLFQNLQAVSMSVIYRRAEPWSSYEAVRRYGPATGTFRVTMRYVLAGSRLPQASTDVGYTYTLKRGRLYLVADNDLDQAIGSNRQPWDFGRIQVVRRTNVVVIVDRGQRALALRLAEETVRSAQQVRKLWPGLLQTVPFVVAMKNPEVLTDLPATTNATATAAGNEPASVRPMPSSLIGNERPSGGWVVIRPGAQRSFDSAQMEHVLMHLLAVRLGDGAPRWLAEGMAEYAGKLALVRAGYSTGVARERQEISTRVLGELTRLPTDHEFTATDSYGISWLAVEQLIKQVGIKPVTEYYRQVARRGYNDAARDRLMVEYTGFTDARLVESLRSLAS
ncbi:hypothetical protein EV644_116122 [Kribbella orskensis]|uniref:Uncharacterized protein n=1 Tax=Kribbella orskensis TaxID=2512216 RepID=A0ABY2BCY4_9ACTN|nr:MULTISPECIES: hypothetical protein [Kribbella]TCN35329.1 hypothetical protein EV642_117123 [Kribbella sp. VKM Ac-2500]TCO16750.1 hypothetical protein EV644_116122 [Kribbella orskensis]